MNYIEEKTKVSFNEPTAETQKPIIKVEEKLIKAEVKNTNNKRKTLEAKLRLIDLQIEREKILQELDNI